MAPWGTLGESRSDSWNGPRTRGTHKTHTGQSQLRNRPIAGLVIGWLQELVVARGAVCGHTAMDGTDRYAQAPVGLTEEGSQIGWIDANRSVNGAP